MQIEFRSNSTVELLDVMGSDDKIAFMARGSLGNGKGTPESNARLVNTLIEEGHKVPLEHCAMTFRLEVPIFVARQLAKHRHSSISELSARYSEMPPTFYVPGHERPLGQQGKRMDYDLVQLSPDVSHEAWARMRASAARAAEDYGYLLGAGVAREVARMVLPVSVYTEMRMTVNLLSLMNIIRLRIGESGERWVGSTHGHPQHEIQDVAYQMAELFELNFPATFQAFRKNNFTI